MPDCISGTHIFSHLKKRSQIKTHLDDKQTRTGQWDKGKPSYLCTTLNRTRQHTEVNTPTHNQEQNTQTRTLQYINQNTLTETH